MGQGYQKLRQALGVHEQKRVPCWQWLDDDDDDDDDNPPKRPRTQCGGTFGVPCDFWEQRGKGFVVAGATVN